MNKFCLKTARLEKVFQLNRCFKNALKILNLVSTGITGSNICSVQAISGLYIYKSFKQASRGLISAPNLPIWAFFWLKNKNGHFEHNLDRLDKIQPHFNWFQPKIGHIVEKIRIFKHLRPKTDNLGRGCLVMKNQDYESFN